MVGRRAAGRDRGAGAERPAAAAGPVSPLHVHWFRRLGDDPYSGAVLYACRCGAVRPGF